MSKYRELRLNQPKLTIKEGAREVIFKVVSCMCDNVYHLTLKKDNNGDFSLVNTVTNAVKAVNTYQNAKTLTGSSIGGEISTIATTGVSRPQQGIYNTTFPVNDQSNIQKATPSKLNGGG